MAPGVNILIVEDEREWQGIYERAVNSQGSGCTVMAAEDLATAERLIDAAKFAVAFIDIGLDVRDDGNVDGLRVMAKIRATGDEETSLVVVTGRSGRDVLAIVRDAIKTYGAYDTVGKSSVVPQQIRELLAGGLEAYQKAVDTSRTAARDAIRGDIPPMRWDDQVIRAISFRGNPGNFYGFLSELMDGQLPIVTRGGGQPVTIDAEQGLVHGDYWSRGTATAAVLCFGAPEQFGKALSSFRSTGTLLGRYQVGEPVNDVNGYGIRGAVFPLKVGQREDFAGGKRAVS